MVRSKFLFTIGRFTKTITMVALIMDGDIKQLKKKKSSRRATKKFMRKMTGRVDIVWRIF